MWKRVLFWVFFPVAVTIMIFMLPVYAIHITCEKFVDWCDEFEKWCFKE